MGEVYEATHDRLSGRYAIKVLLSEISNRADIFQRFRREAEVTSGLRHPNIVQILDFNVTPEGHPYLVMEYLDGIELATEIGRVGAMPIGRVLDIVGQIASALTAAHNHKIVHRDLKPQNLFLVRLPGEDREVVKVVDFGISKVREATTKLTQEAAIMGTPQYMAPEQAEGKLAQIDERTDEFALAAITYELLTGRSVFGGGSIPSILYQVVHQAPEPIRKLVPTVGPAVEAVVLKALSKSQDQRYPTVLAFHRELARAAATDHDVHTVELPEPVAAHTPWVLPEQPNPTTLGLAAGTLETNTKPHSLPRAWLLAFSILTVLAVVTAAVFGLRRVPARVTPLLPAPPPSVVATPVAPTPAGIPKFATVEVENAPPDLHVTVDGVTKELPLTLPAGPTSHILLFTAPGYESTEVHVDGMREHRSLVLAMKPLAQPTREPAVEKKLPNPKKLAPTGAEKSAASKPVDKKIRKTGRGAEMSEEFE
jgi:tRNA A-37 threonylcarbamoyl transferase component Bud32